MRKNIILLVIIMFVALLSSCFRQNKNDSDKLRKGWTLVWEDDFGGSLDETEWSKIRKGKLNINRYMSDSAALYISQDGNIVLRGILNPADDEKFPFLTGGITREGIKANETKRIEIRSRMNPVSGAIPYISLVPTNGMENITIDIMERYGMDEFVYQSVTSEYTTTQGMPDNPPSSALVGVDPNRYHIYGVEKHPDSLVFFVDGVRTKKYPRIPTEIPGQFPYNDLDFNLFIGLRLNKDADPAGLPADMFIDWVRYYEPEVTATTVTEK